MSLSRHDWMMMILTSVATTAVNVLLFAFSYGQLINRVENLEQWRSELRAEWAAARERVERAVKEEPPRK